MNIKEQLPVAALTLVIFSLGFAAGHWSRRPMMNPRPFPQPMGEFDGQRRPGGPGKGPGPNQGPQMQRPMGNDRPQFPGNAGPGNGGPGMPPPNGEGMREPNPEMDAFRAKVQEIEDSFRQKTGALLKPEQKTKWDNMVPKKAGQPGEQQPPQANGEFHRPRPQGGGQGNPPGEPHFIGMIIYRPVLERVGTELNLDASQKKTFEGLLRERREKILQLVDTTPPPTIQFRQGGGPPDSR